jgi:hypothetical protein
MKRLLVAAAAVATLALSACATPTPYQPLSANARASGGFAERPLEQNRWMVSFSGNSLTDRRTVETYLLYRAAELTVAQGYDWFTIVDRNTERNTQVYADPFYNDPFYWRPWAGAGFWSPSWRLYNAGRWGGWGPWSPWGYWGSGFGPGWGPSALDYREVTRYEANAEIFMGKGAKPGTDPRAFDAREVLQRLGPSIVRPTA